MKLSDIIEKAYISAGLHFNRESDNIFSIEYQDEEIVVIANEQIWALSVLVKIDKSDILKQNLIKELQKILISKSSFSFKTDQSPVSRM